MSVKLMSAIFETEFRDLTDAEGNVTKASTAKIVCLALADHANDEGEGAYPSVTRLERKTALSRQCVINTLDALKYNGIARLEGVSKRNTNNYTIEPNCFPRSADRDSIPALLVNPVTSASTPGVPELVNPVDPNHTITIIEPSTLSQIEKSANKTVDAVLQISLSPKAIQDAMAKFFKLTPRWEGNKFNREWMQWAIEEGITPEQVEKAADKWRSDTKFNWAQPSLKLIQERWLMLTETDPRQEKGHWL